LIINSAKEISRDSPYKQKKGGGGYLGEGLQGGPEKSHVLVMLCYAHLQQRIKLEVPLMNEPSTVYGKKRNAYRNCKYENCPLSEPICTARVCTTLKR
jgi:hypothetical protein